MEAVTCYLGTTAIDPKTARLFLKKMTLGDLGRLIGGPMHHEVESEVVSRLTVDKTNVLAYFMSWGLDKEMRGLKWPLQVQEAAKTLLSDPREVRDVQWNRVRFFLEENLAREIDKARREAKRKEAKRKEAKRKRRKASRQVQNDPLLQVILKGDTSRMERFELERLSPERWEKLKEAWLRSDPPIKRWMMRLPWKIVEPYALEVLNLAGEDLADEDPPYVPAWPIPKETLKKLSPSSLFVWLSRLFNFYERYEDLKVEPKLTWRELQEDLKPLLVAAALENEEVQCMMDWLDLLYEFRRTLRLGREMGGKLTRQEIAKMESLLRGFDNPYLYPRESLKGMPHLVELLKWIASLPDAHRARFGNYLRKSNQKEPLRGFEPDLMEEVLEFED
jgi:hypothetical protein